eukprot:1794186-Rhodomonas_salina.2
MLGYPTQASGKSESPDVGVTSCRERCVGVVDGCPGYTVEAVAHGDAADPLLAARLPLDPALGGPVTQPASTVRGSVRPSCIHSPTAGLPAAHHSCDHDAARSSTSHWDCDSRAHPALHAHVTPSALRKALALHGAHALHGPATPPPTQRDAAAMQRCGTRVLTPVPSAQMHMMARAH